MFEVGDLVCYKNEVKEKYPEYPYIHDLFLVSRVFKPGIMLFCRAVDSTRTFYTSSENVTKVYKNQPLEELL